MSKSYHIPGRPTTPEPPELVRLALSLHHKDVVSTGLTTTAEGRWALLVTVKPDTPVPINEIEKLSHYPVIYQGGAGRLPVARPAYPSLGE